MIKVILFDKFKNRKEDAVEKVEDEMIIESDDQKIKYKLQFYDAKRRAVYVEQSRTEIK